MGSPTQESDPFGELDPARAELAAKLRSLRRQRGMAQRDLARALRFASHSFIGEFERGTRLPAAEVLSAYERFLDLPAGQLLGLRDRVLAETAACAERQQRRPVAKTGRTPAPEQSTTTSAGVPSTGAPERPSPHRRGIEATYRPWS